MKKEERCGEHPKTTKEKGKYLDFIKQLNKEEKREFLKISAWALRPLINEKNKQIKQNAILSISKSFKSKKHPITGKFMKKKLTQEDIIGVLNKSREEVRRERIVEEILKTGRIKIDTNVIRVCSECNKKYRILHNEPTGTHSLVDAETSDITTELRITDDVNEIFGEVKKRFDEVKEKFNERRIRRCPYTRLSMCLMQVKEKFNERRIRRLYMLINNPKIFREYFMANGDTRVNIFNNKAISFYVDPYLRGRHEIDKLFPSRRRHIKRHHRNRPGRNAHLSFRTNKECIKRIDDMAKKMAKKTGKTSNAIINEIIESETEKLLNILNSIKEQYKIDF